MTPDQLRAAVPGRELDREIALSLGWKYLEPDAPWLERWAVPGCGIVFGTDLPDWSTSDACAVELLGEAAKRGWRISVNNKPLFGDAAWCAYITVPARAHDFYGTGATFSEAVAKAWLLACGEAK